MFLGENAMQEKQPLPVEAEKERRLHLSTPSVEKAAFSSAHSDANSTFQGVNEKDSRIPLIPPSLNIKDVAKESALIKRIQGDMAPSAFTTPECPDIISKVTNEANSQLVSDVNEPMTDELELDGVDMNDVPLLQDEDINMAVLSLKDIRKADFRPELLLKTNDEDFKELRDVGTLESVLSTVIDLEMQEMYQKVIPQSEPVDMSSKGGIYASSMLPELGTSQLSDVDSLSLPTFETQNTLPSTSQVISDPAEASAGADMFQYKMSNTVPSLTVVPALTKANSVVSLMPDCERDVSSDNILPVPTLHKVCSSPGQFVSSTSSTHETMNVYSHHSENIHHPQDQQKQGRSITKSKSC